MKDIVIVGAGGFAREVAWLVRDVNRGSEPIWNLLGFIDAKSDRIGHPIGDCSIIGDDEWLLHQEHPLNVVIGIGSPVLLQKTSDSLTRNGNLQFPNIIHPTVIWDTDRIEIGRGNIVGAGNILTTDIRIGSFNILNLASTFGHDAVIGNCCVVNPGVNLSGGVSLGDRCLIGTGSVILENLAIQHDVTVGGGAVVTRHVQAGLTVVGIPAKPLVK